MFDEIIRRLAEITPEEQRILDGDESVQKDLYTSDPNFIVDSRHFLEKGRWIDVRANTRFVYFPPHRHNYIEMVFVLSGHLTTTINSARTLILSEGDILLMNQKAVHDIRPCGIEDVAVNFMILPEFFHRGIIRLDEKNLMRDFLISTLVQGEGMKMQPDPQHTNRKGADQAAGDFLLFHTKGIIPVENLIENLLWNILISRKGMSTISQTTMELLFMNLSALSRDVRAAEEGNWKDTVLTVLEYIDAHYTDGTLEEIAKKTGYTTYSLSRLLKTRTGKNFKQLLQDRRLQQAAYYLENTTLPVSRIIEKIGYENSSYFYRVYKDYYGISPREYRSVRAGNISG